MKPSKDFRKFREFSHVGVAQQGPKLVHHHLLDLVDAQDGQRALDVCKRLAATRQRASCLSLYTLDSCKYSPSALNPVTASPPDQVYSRNASKRAMTLSSGVSGMIEWLVPPM